MTAVAEPVAAPARGGARREWVFPVVVFVALALVGEQLGFLWAWWSPPGPRAFVYAPGVYGPDQTESWIGADGRYLVLVAGVGLLAAVLAWLRVRSRGSLTLLALVAGSLLGAWLTQAVGHHSGGGSYRGAANTVLDQLPLALHMKGLVFVEPAVAALVYGLCVAFAKDDDLGHPDPLRRRHRRPDPAPVAAWGPPPIQPPGVSQLPPGLSGAPSVQPGRPPENSGGYGDGASPLQQRDLPPQ